MNAVPSSIDQDKRRIKQISTGVCIFLFITSLAFPVYIALMSINKSVTKNFINTVIIKAPSLTQYAQLHSTFPQTLTCPCQKPSIDYGKFLHMGYTLHQVCNSVFVTQDWIFNLAVPTGATLFPEDFRATGAHSFQALSTFCKLIKRTIDHNLIQFYSNQYVSLSVTPSALLQVQTQSRINQFRSAMINSFLLSFSLIRDTIQGNALFSGLQTNYRLYVGNSSNNVLTQASSHNGCNCGLSSTCISQSVIYKYPDITSLFIVPGFYTGCYVIESLLQSNLQCLYDQMCIDNLQTYLTASLPTNVRALDPSLSSQYYKDSSIQELLDNLMIEQLNVSIMYERYYDECQPIECSYTVQTDDTGESRNDTIYILAILIGVIGGLITILKLIVPLLVKFIVYAIRKCESRISSKMPIVQT